MGTKNLEAHYGPNEIIRDAPFQSSWVSRKSGLAINVTARLPKLATVFQAVEWVDEKRDGKAVPAPMPVRFVANNKLTRSDRLLMAFDAYVLGKLVNSSVTFARVVHGDRKATHKIKTSELEGDVRKIISKITNTISAAEPPKLVLNRHCTECIFQERCRSQAVERDDLVCSRRCRTRSERSSITRAFSRLRSFPTYFAPGAATQTPSRATREVSSRPQGASHPRKKVHVVDVSPFSITGTPVFIDVESLPDRDFYYLIGLRWPSENGILQRSLRADECGDEVKLWADLLDILSSIESPTVIHYGSFEATFFKKMTDRYGGPREDSVAAKALGSAINVLSVIFAHIYFPTYSNSLKQIANYLGFTWGDPASSGLQSIVWRHKWERSRDPMLKKKLFSYNTEDCKALSIVTEAIMACTEPRLASAVDNVEIVQVETLAKTLDTKWEKIQKLDSGSRTD